MPIKVGLFGFGRTGSVVASEIAKDPALSLQWVCRRHVESNQTYASRVLGHDSDFAPFVAIDDLSESFLNTHPVDMVIDFSTGTTTQIYDKLADLKIKVVSAISNYNDQELSRVKAASSNTAVLYSPNITLGINWLLMASKILKSIK